MARDTCSLSATSSTFINSDDCIVITSERKILSAGNDEVIGLWEIDEENQVEFLHGHSSGVLAIALINKETELISSGLDLTIRMWSLISKIQTRKFQTGNDIINTIAICGSQSYFHTGGCDNIIKKCRIVDR